MKNPSSPNLVFTPKNLLRFLASLVAVFGEFDISGELESRRSVTRNIRRVIVNRAYDPATFENDLALLELDTPIQFDAHIVPICMPDDNTDYVNRMATVTGWGRLKYSEYYYQLLYCVTGSYLLCLFGSVFALNYRKLDMTMFVRGMGSIIVCFQSSATIYTKNYFFPQMEACHRCCRR